MKNLFRVILTVALIMAGFLGSALPASAGWSSQDVRSAVGAHRAQSGVPVQREDSQMTAAAQAWAEKLASSDGSASQDPSKNGFLGGAQLVGSHSAGDVSAVIEGWKSGANNILISKTYGLIGSGVATSASGKVYVVANFRPAPAAAPVAPPAAPVPAPIAPKPAPVPVPVVVPEPEPAAPEPAPVPVPSKAPVAPKPTSTPKPEPKPTPAPKPSSVPEEQPTETPQASSPPMPSPEPTSTAEANPKPAEEPTGEAQKGLRSWLTLIVCTSGFVSLLSIGTLILLRKKAGMAVIENTSVLSSEAEQVGEGSEEDDFDRAIKGTAKIREPLPNLTSSLPILPKVRRDEKLENNEK